MAPSNAFLSPMPTLASARPAVLSSCGADVARLRSRRASAFAGSIDAACELFGSDDFYERCGRAIVEYEINVLLRFALQLTTPLGVVERAGDPWRKVHSAGNWTIDGDKYHVVAQLDGFPTTAGYCRLLTAYFHRLFELTGARNVVLEHPTCVARGNGACRFEGRWNP